MSRIELTPEGQVIALLCSRLALPPDAPAPFSNAEWNRLTVTLAAAGIAPAALLDTSTAALGCDCGLDEPTADRIQRLLVRAGQFALELDQLADRGVWLLTTAEPGYPARLKQRLGTRAPALLFGAGPAKLAAEGGLAVVGSREADEESTEFASKLGEAAAAATVSLISGGARGIDRLSMNAALAHGGTAVGVVAESLERTIREPECRQFILDGRLTLLTPYHYAAPFTIGNAMGRNKLIYCLADFAVVVAAAEGTGGTWAGALEDLKGRWAPLFVRDGPSVPPGNTQLIAKGALALPRPPSFEELEAAAAGWQQASETRLWDRPPAADSGALAPNVAAAMPLAGDFADLVRFCAQPRKLKEIAEKFQLKTAQAKRLIAEAVEAKVIERAAKPKAAYVAVERLGETAALFP